MTDLIRLHIGGRERRPGWTVLNVQPGDATDIVGNCVSLSMFDTASVDDIYASHVLEHLGFRHELPTALLECHRVLKPNGRLLVSVPDLDTLCRLILHDRLSLDEKAFMMMHLFGGQDDEYDFHKVGLNFGILKNFLEQAGFCHVERVAEFGLFNDGSSLRRFGVPISLNVVAKKGS